MTVAEEAGESQADREHLKLLALFHYIVGGLTMLFACLPLIHIAMGVAILFAPEMFGPPKAHPPGDRFFGILFIGMGSLFFIIGQAIAVCILLSGRYISQRRRHLFVFVTGCVQCMFFPVGTALGVFTIIVLSRDSVRRAFNVQGNSVHT